MSIGGIRTLIAEVIPEAAFVPDETSGQVFTLMAVVMLALAPVLKRIAERLEKWGEGASGRTKALAKVFHLNAKQVSGFGLLFAVLGAYMFIADRGVVAPTVGFAVCLLLLPFLVLVTSTSIRWLIRYMEEAEFFALSYRTRNLFVKLLLDDLGPREKAKKPANTL